MHYTKLQKPPRVRPRVYQLAKQVGLTSAELIALLIGFGEYVRTAQDLVELPVVRKVHQERGIIYEAPQAKGPSSEPLPTLPSSGLSPPQIRVRRDNHPTRKAAERSRDQDQGRHRTGRRPRNRADLSGIRASDAYATASRAEASIAFEFEEWKLRGFTDSERDVLGSCWSTPETGQDRSHPARRGPAPR
jgi:hypothetical protein